MVTKGQRVLNVSELRSELTGAGDVRSAVAFQNDVNALIAVVAQLEAQPPDDRQVVGLEAPFGFLPPRPIDLGARRRRRAAEAALGRLVATVEERQQRLLQVR